MELSCLGNGVATKPPSGPLASADCLVIREPFAPAAEAGAPCAVVDLQF